MFRRSARRPCRRSLSISGSRRVMVPLSSKVETRFVARQVQREIEGDLPSVRGLHAARAADIGPPLSLCFWTTLMGPADFAAVARGRRLIRQGSDSGKVLHFLPSMAPGWYRAAIAAAAGPACVFRPPSSLAGWARSAKIWRKLVVLVISLDRERFSWLAVSWTLNPGFSRCAPCGGWATLQRGVPGNQAHRGLAARCAAPATIGRFSIPKPHARSLRRAVSHGHISSSYSS